MTTDRFAHRALYLQAELRDLIDRRDQNQNVGPLIAATRLLLLQEEHKLAERGQYLTPNGNLVRIPEMVA